MQPVVLSDQRDGINVESLAGSISKELLDVLNYAYVWGRSAKHSPQRVGTAHLVRDDVFTLSSQILMSVCP